MIATRRRRSDSTEELDGMRRGGRYSCAIRLHASGMMAPSRRAETVFSIVLEHFTERSATAKDPAAEAAAKSQRAGCAVRAAGTL